MEENVDTCMNIFDVTRERLREGGGRVWGNSVKMGRRNCIDDTVTHVL
jgi:hypothetical protein